MRILTTTIALLLSLTNIFGQAAQPKLIITPLTGDFFVYTTFNTYQGNLIPANGMYLVTENGVAVFDSPWDTTQFQPLLDSIKWRHHKKVVMCIATHSHEDRTGGLEYYRQQGIKTYTTKQTDDICKARGRKRAEYLISKDTVFRVGQYAFQTYYAGQGHTPDNIVIWFDKARVLYGGCLIKSVEASNLGNLADANVKAWGGTLLNIQHKFGEPEYIIPGHQAWTSKKSLKHTLRMVRQYNRKSRH
jgi:metallo-beta-lactamase class B